MPYSIIDSYNYFTSTWRKTQALQSQMSKNMRRGTRSATFAMSCLLPPLFAPTNGVPVHAHQLKNGSILINLNLGQCRRNNLTDNATPKLCRLCWVLKTFDNRFDDLHSFKTTVYKRHGSEVYVNITSSEVWNRYGIQQTENKTWQICSHYTR